MSHSWTFVNQMVDATTIETENGYAAGLAEARNRNTTEEEPDESEEMRKPAEKKMEFGTALLLALIAGFCTLLGLIPLIGIVFNWLGWGIIIFWWAAGGWKPPSFSKSLKVPGAQKVAEATVGKAEEAIEKIPVAGKWLAFGLSFLLGLLPGGGISLLGLVWGIYQANK